MQLPKAIRVSSVNDAELVVDVYNRALLFVVEVDGGDRFYRLTPAGKCEDLTEKVRKAYALVSGSSPMKQGSVFDGDEKASSRSRKSA